jgi:hypothetical protein
MSSLKSKPKPRVHHNQIVDSFLRSSEQTLSTMWQKIEERNGPDTIHRLNNLFMERNPMQTSEVERKIWIILELFKAMVEHDLANLSTEPQTTSSHHLEVELDQFLQKVEHADRVCMKVRRIFLVENNEETHRSIQQAVSKLLPN